MWWIINFKAVIKLNQNRAGWVPKIWSYFYISVSPWEGFSFFCCFLFWDSTLSSLHRWSPEEDFTPLVTNKHKHLQFWLLLLSQTLSRLAIKQPRKQSKKSINKQNCASFSKQGIQKTLLWCCLQIFPIYLKEILMISGIKDTETGLQIIQTQVN